MFSIAVGSALLNMDWNSKLKIDPKAFRGIRSTLGKGATKSIGRAITRGLTRGAALAARVPKIGWIGALALGGGAMLSRVIGDATEGEGPDVRRLYRDSIKLGEPLTSVASGFVRSGRYRTDSMSMDYFDRTKEDAHKEYRKYRASLSPEVLALHDSNMDILAARWSLLNDPNYKTNIGSHLSSYYSQDKKRELEKLMLVLSNDFATKNIHIPSFYKNIYGAGSGMVDYKRLYADYANLFGTDDKSTHRLMQHLQKGIKHTGADGKVSWSLRQPLGQRITPSSLDKTFAAHKSLRDIQVEKAIKDLEEEGGLGEDGLSSHSRSATRGVLSKIHIEIHEMVAMKDVDFSFDGDTTTEQIEKAAMTVNEAASRQLAKALLEGVARVGAGGSPLRTAYD